MATSSFCSTLRTAVLRQSSSLVGPSERTSCSLYLNVHKSPAPLLKRTCPGLPKLRRNQSMATRSKRDRSGRTIAPKAALAERPTQTEATKDTEGMLPGASGDDATLDVDTLKLAHHAALLSSLAYKEPVQVEYLRYLARGMSKEKTLNQLKEQAGGTLPKELNAEAIAKLESDNATLHYTEMLAQFDEPSQYFDGKQSLFMKATVAYLFFCRTPPEDQPNIIYVVFRGTEGPEDLVTDIELAPVEIRPTARDIKGQDVSKALYAGLEKDKVLLHLGFRDQFVAVSTALTRNVEAAARGVAQPSSHVTVPQGPARLTDLFKAKVNAQKKTASGVEVVVAGHSLGAALATIGSFVSFLDHPEVRCSYFGFGSPRVGNAHFAEVYKRASNGQVYHFANKNDPVTGVPIPPRYVHVQGGHMLDEPTKGSVVATPLADEGALSLTAAADLLKKQAGYLGFLAKQGRGEVPWSQHDMGLYVHRVRALYETAKAKGK